MHFLFQAKFVFTIYIKSFVYPENERKAWKTFIKSLELVAGDVLSFWRFTSKLFLF